MNLSLYGPGVCVCVLTCCCCVAAHRTVLRRRGVCDVFRGSCCSWTVAVLQGPSGALGALLSLSWWSSSSEGGWLGLSSVQDSALHQVAVSSPGEEGEDRGRTEGGQRGGRVMKGSHTDVPTPAGLHCTSQEMSCSASGVKLQSQQPPLHHLHHPHHTQVTLIT